MDAACTVLTVDRFTMDFSINPARDGRQTQKSFVEPLWAGREPMATMTSRTAAKIAKRRIGRSSGGRYGGCVMVVPQKLQNKIGACSGPNLLACNPHETNRFIGHSKKEMSVSGQRCSESDSGGKSANQTPCVSTAFPGRTSATAVRSSLQGCLPGRSKRETRDRG
jgi:hypothetical protein